MSNQYYDVLTKRDLSAYEVIHQMNVALYLDIEIDCEICCDIDEVMIKENIMNRFIYSGFDINGLNENDLDEIWTVFKDLKTNRPINSMEMGDIGKLLYNISKSFTEMVFPERTSNQGSNPNQKIDVYSACRENKLSFHMVYRNLIFDHHNTSMVFFVFELIMHTQKKILEKLLELLELLRNNGSSTCLNNSSSTCLNNSSSTCLNNSSSTCLNNSSSTCLNSQIRQAVACLLYDKSSLVASPIDIAPYTRNQCFRIPGCGKNGQNRLRPINIFEEHVFYRNDATFTGLVSNSKAFTDSLVSGLNAQYQLSQSNFAAINLWPGNYPRYILVSHKPASNRVRNGIR
jgi:hypothetical protein